MSKRVRVWVDVTDDEDGTLQYVSLCGFDVWQDGAQLSTNVKAYRRREGELAVDVFADTLGEAWDWQGEQEAFPL